MSQIFELHRRIYQDLREDGECTDESVMHHVQMVERLFGRSVTTEEQAVALCLARRDTELVA